MNVDTSKERNGILYVALAEATAGVREQGDNTGVRVQEYQRAGGVGKGASWCAAFITWALVKGLDLPSRPAWCMGSASGMWSNALIKLTAARGFSDYIAVPGQENKIKAGWLWARAQDAETAASTRRRGGYGKGHIGIVVTPRAPTPAEFLTVEGNTNAAGSRDGDGVYRKVQKFNDPRIIGYFDPVALTMSYLDDAQLQAFIQRMNSGGSRTA
jgi:hypothetical protein